MITRSRNWLSRPVQYEYIWQLSAGEERPFEPGKRISAALRKVKSSIMDRLSSASNPIRSRTRLSAPLACNGDTYAAYAHSESDAEQNGECEAVVGAGVRRYTCSSSFVSAREADNKTKAIAGKAGGAGGEKTCAQKQQSQQEPLQCCRRALTVSLSSGPSSAHTQISKSQLSRQLRQMHSADSRFFNFVRHLSGADDVALGLRASKHSSELESLGKIATPIADGDELPPLSAPPPPPVFSTLATDIPSLSVELAEIAYIET